MLKYNYLECISEVSELKMRKAIFLIVIAIGVLGLVFLIQWHPEPEKETILPQNGMESGPNTVVFLGDSITEGYGVEKNAAFPSVIQNYWDRNNIHLQAVNAGISGNTTDDVLSRMDSLLTQDVCMVFLEIGANDAFQFREIEDIKSNMKSIIEKIQAKGIKVTLMAMEMPEKLAGYKKDYAKKFAKMYEEVGKECNILVLSSFVKENETNSSLWTSDGIHPSAQGHILIAQKVLKFFNPSWVLD